MCMFPIHHHYSLNLLHFPYLVHWLHLVHCLYQPHSTALTRPHQRFPLSRGKIPQWSMCSILALSIWLYPYPPNPLPLTMWLIGSGDPLQATQSQHWWLPVGLTHKTSRVAWWSTWATTTAAPSSASTSPASATLDLSLWPTRDLLLKFPSTGATWQHLALGATFTRLNLIKPVGAPDFPLSPFPFESYWFNYLTLHNRISFILEVYFKCLIICFQSNNHLQAVSVDWRVESQQRRFIHTNIQRYRELTKSFLLSLSVSDLNSLSSYFATLFWLDEHVFAVIQMIIFYLYLLSLSQSNRRLTSDFNHRFCLDGSIL